MVGLQGSGKSTWVRKHLPASHVVVSKDYWPRARNREARQRRAVEDALAAGYSVVVPPALDAGFDRVDVVTAEEDCS